MNIDHQKADFPIENFVCLNPSCSDFNKVGEKNITHASPIARKNKELTQRWHCITCNKFFSANYGRVMYKLHTDQETLIAVVNYYISGEAITSIAEKVGYNTRTVSSWLKRIIGEETFLSDTCHLSQEQIEQFRMKYATRRNSKFSK